MNGVTQLVAFLRLLWRSVLFGLFVDAVKDLLNTYGKDNVNMLAEAAKEKVAEVEAKYGPGSGEAKKAETLAYLKDISIAKGLEISSHVFNFLIENAVAALNTIDPTPDN